MPLLRGTASPDAIYRGANPVDRVYRGANLVWEPPVSGTTFRNSMMGFADGTTPGVGAGGDTPFDYVRIDGSNTMQALLEARTSRGSDRGVRCSVNAGSSWSAVGWDVPTNGDSYAMCYFRMPDPQSTIQPRVVRATLNTTYAWEMRVNDGYLVWANTDGGGSIFQSANRLEPGNVYRVEFHATRTNATCEFKVFSGDSTTELPVDYFGGGIPDIGRDWNRIYFGHMAGGTPLTAYSADIGPVGWSDTTWVGPAAITDPYVSHYFNFDGGTDGAYIGTGDTGSGTQWDTASTNVLTYDAAAARNGALGHRKVADTQGHLQWNNATQEAKHTIGCWFRASARPPGDGRVMDIRETTGSGTVGGFLYTVEGRIRIMYSSIGIVAGQSPPLDLDAWYWISHTIDLTTNTGRIRIYTEDGTLWHDSGDQVSAYTRTSGQTSRWIGQVIWGAGNTDFDDLQWQPGSAAPLLPWLP